METKTSHIWQYLALLAVFFGVAGGLVFAKYRHSPSETAVQVKNETANSIHAAANTAKPDSVKVAEASAKPSPETTLNAENLVGSKGKIVIPEDYTQDIPLYGEEADRVIISAGFSAYQGKKLLKAMYFVNPKGPSQATFEKIRSFYTKELTDRHWEFKEIVDVNPNHDLIEGTSGDDTLTLTMGITDDLAVAIDMYPKTMGKVDSATRPGPGFPVPSTFPADFPLPGKDGLREYEEHYGLDNAGDRRYYTDTFKIPTSESSLVELKKTYRDSASKMGWKMRKTILPKMSNGGKPDGEEAAFLAMSQNTLIFEKNDNMLNMQVLPAAFLGGGSDSYFISIETRKKSEYDDMYSQPFADGESMEIQDTPELRMAIPSPAPTSSLPITLSDIVEKPILSPMGTTIGLSISYTFTGSPKVIRPWFGFPKGVVDSESYARTCNEVLPGSDLEIDPPINRNETDPKVTYHATVNCTSPVLPYYSPKRGWGVPDQNQCVLKPQIGKSAYEVIFSDAHPIQSGGILFSQKYTTKEFDHQALYDHLWHVEKLKDCTTHEYDMELPALTETRSNNFFTVPYPKGWTVRDDSSGEMNGQYWYVPSNPEENMYREKSLYIQWGNTISSLEDSIKHSNGWCQKILLNEDITIDGIAAKKIICQDNYSPPVTYGQLRTVEPINGKFISINFNGKDYQGMAEEIGNKIHFNR